MFATCVIVYKALPVAAVVGPELARVMYTQTQNNSND